MANSFNLRGKLTVIIHEARNLFVKQLIGEMDPYAQIKIKGEKFKTPVAENGHRNPKWNYSFIANLDGDEDGLHIKILNKGNVTDDEHSRCDIIMTDMDLSNKPAWYSLKDPSNFSKEDGEISLSIMFEGSGIPPNCKADITNKARLGAVTPGGPATSNGAVAPLMSPTSPQHSQQVPQQSPQQQQPQYAPLPQGYAQPQQVPMGQPQYQQPGQPQYQQPQYAQPQYQQPGQPQYAPLPQQPQYQQMPVYQQPAQPMYQQPGQVTFQPAPVMYQPAPTVVYQQPAPVQYAPLPVQPQVIVVQQQAPAPQPQQSSGGFMSSLSAGLSSMAVSAAAGLQTIATALTTASGKWDSAGYLREHPDVARAGMDAWDHYVKHGKGENRNIVLHNGKEGKWDDAGYWKLHPDVAKANFPAWDHYVKHGKGENRDIAITYAPSQAPSNNGTTGKWDDAGYLREHPDVARAGMPAWDHYHKHGNPHSENRTIVLHTGAKGKFDKAAYLRLHPDVARANMDAWDHYMKHGKGENRDIAVTAVVSVASPFNLFGGAAKQGKWDSAGYLREHPDVARAGMDAWDHYYKHGNPNSENRTIVLSNGAKGKFDRAAYLRIHGDVARAGMDGWDHFMKHGKGENRDIAVQ